MLRKFQIWNQDYVCFCYLDLCLWLWKDEYNLKFTSRCLAVLTKLLPLLKPLHVEKICDGTEYTDQVMLYNKIYIMNRAMQKSAHLRMLTLVFVCPWHYGCLCFPQLSQFFYILRSQFWVLFFCVSREGQKLRVYVGTPWGSGRLASPTCVTEG